MNQQTIFPLLYLSNKYEYETLTRKIEEIIDTHHDEILIETIIFKIKMKLNTTKEEEILSNNFEQYMNEEEIFSIPIEHLKRIIDKIEDNSNNQNVNKTKHQNKINFLMKTLDRYGKDASILFNNIEFGEENIEIISKLIQEYSNKFDFNMIQNNLFKSTKEILNEMNQQKYEYYEIFSRMKKENEKMKEEMKEIFEKEKKYIDELENKYKNEISIMKNEYLQMKINNDKEILNIQKEFEKIIKEYEEQKQNNSIEQDHQILLETMNIDDFKNINESTRKYFIQEIIKQQNQNHHKNKLIQRILFINKYYENLIKENQNYHDDENRPISNSDFDIRMKFILDHLDKISVKYYTVVDLYQKNQLDTFLNEINENYEECKIELKYPSSSFIQINNNINDIFNKFPKFINKIKILYKIFDSTNNSEETSIRTENHIFTIQLQYPLNKEAFLVVIEQYLNKIKGFSEIKDNAFCYCSVLTEVTIPSSIISIGKNSFENCTSLTKITIPSSIKTIGKQAFYKCSSLKQIVIPSSVTSIENGAFSDCRSLTEISIPSSITSIRYETFNRCSSLKKIMIPPTVTSIGSYAFANCSSLVEILIPSFVTSIGSGAFCGCSSLTHISIPSSVTSIESYTFSGCSSLSYISIPSSVTSMKSRVFDDCSSLTQLSIPHPLNFKENDTFLYNSKLIYISISRSTDISKVALNSNTIVHKT